ncbi:MAG: hypothetical protein QOE79_579 [Sphingomonadales bacterium]|jgi:hypothetical protein|nr:hypothetical protein [Sphingomonadales bacterium]MEA3050534.1 hypothetical protein [Sphingomonadales bacterium]
MLTFALLMAAAPARLELASLDEMRWRSFVRASVSASLSPRMDRIDELNAVVARLPSDRGDFRHAVAHGPSGL